MRIYKSFRSGNRITLFNGDCIDLLKSMPDESVDLVVTSPPYCIGKAYEDPHDDIETFKTLHTNIFNDMYRVLKVGGSVCWQIGYHNSNATKVPRTVLTQIKRIKNPIDDESIASLDLIAFSNCLQKASSSNV